MAPVSSLGSNSIASRIFDSSSTPLTHIKRVARCGNQPAVALYFNNKNQQTATTTSIRACMVEQDLKKNGSIERREALLGIAFTVFSLPSLVQIALADDDVLKDFVLYSDDTKKFKLVVPRDWRVGEGKSDGIRSLTAFFPEENSSSNVSVLVSGLGADYTKLESFGKVDEFAETLVSGLDRSWQNPPGVAAKLLNSKSKNGMYYIEYLLEKPGESARHIYSVLGMASSTWYNKLYTVTGQFTEDESEKYKSTIEKAVLSFRLT